MNIEELIEKCTHNESDKNNIGAIYPLIKHHDNTRWKIVDDQDPMIGEEKRNIAIGKTLKEALEIFYSQTNK